MTPHSLASYQENHLNIATMDLTNSDITSKIVVPLLYASNDCVLARSRSISSLFMHYVYR
jgi:hypothetical protein